EQHCFDLARRQVLAAADDDIVEAAVEEQVAVGVEVTRVPGVEPAAGVGFDGPAVVLTRDLVAPDEDGAHLSPGQRLAGGTPDLDRHAGQGPADRTEPRS